MAQNAQQGSSNILFPGTIYASVRQDKSAALAARPASTSGYRAENSVQSVPGNSTTKTAPSPSGSNRVPLTTQLTREVKQEIERLAKQGKGRTGTLSVSAVAAAFLERAVQQNIDMQYGALLGPVIERAVKKEIESFSNRSAHLAVNAYYAAEQARILCITILSLLLGGDTDALPGIVSQSQKQAHENLTRHPLSAEEDE